jgi:tetratricopeptide (TPR) repeat protein
MANVHHMQGAFRRALELLEKSAAIHHELGQKGDYLYAMNNMAATLSVLGEYDRSIGISRETLTIAEELRFPQQVIAALDHLGFAFLCKDDYAQADASFRAGLDIARPAGFRRETMFMCAGLAESAYLSRYAQSAPTRGGSRCPPVVTPSTFTKRPFTSQPSRSMRASVRTA